MLEDMLLQFDRKLFKGGLTLLMVCRGTLRIGAAADFSSRQVFLSAPVMRIVGNEVFSG